MPTTCPRRLKSGPPLLPGLMLASVWMKSSYGPAPIVRPLALTMPIVTVLPRPNGLPMATTYSPTRERLARAERGDGQIGGRVLELEHRDVEPRVLADHLGAELAVVGELHLDDVGAVDDVRVGDDVALRVDEEARAERLALEDLISISSALARTEREKRIDPEREIAATFGPTSFVNGRDVDDRRVDLRDERRDVGRAGQERRRRERRGGRRRGCDRSLLRGRGGNLRPIMALCAGGRRVLASREESQGEKGDGNGPVKARKRSHLSRPTCGALDSFPNRGRVPLAAGSVAGNFTPLAGHRLEASLELGQARSCGCDRRGPRRLGGVTGRDWDRSRGDRSGRGRCG